MFFFKRVGNKINKGLVLFRKGNTYGIVRRNSENAGLFSFFITNVGYVKYCIDNNQIPVIDMESINNSILPSKIGNTWTYFFTQPDNNIYDLSSLYKKRKYIVYNDIPKYMPNDSLDFMLDPTKVIMWRDFYHKHFDYSELMKPLITKYEKELLCGKRTLGVLCRGTDYINLEPKDHPVQPNVDLIIEKCKLKLKKNNCQQIFLVTEDESILKSFKQSFRDKLIYIEGKRYSKTGDNFLSDYRNQDPNFGDNDQIQIAENYFLSIVMLSKCNCIVAGRTSGTVAAQIMSHGYEDEYYFSLGLYGSESYHYFKNMYSCNLTAEV